jgi:hypothetical protein
MRGTHKREAEHTQQEAREMNKSKARAVLAATALGALALAAGPARAALGGTPTISAAAPAQTQADVAAKSKAAAASPAALAAASAANWSARQTTLADGTIEREYVGADGNVFAVAWRGPRRPELSALLGADYATQMAQMAKEAREAGVGSHAQVASQTPTLGVRATQFQRFSAGVAWLPSKLPAGVDPDALALSPSAN